MVNTLKVNQWSELSQRMNIVPKEMFDQFVVSVLSWYNYEGKGFAYFNKRDEREAVYPPNLFYLFEYPTQVAESCLQFFIRDDMTLREFNDSLPLMKMDIARILNAYSVFYCFSDTDYEEVQLYNIPTNEVW